MEIKARYILIGLFTLVVILAGFGFVYWLNNAGGLSARTAFRLQFDNSVSGLLRGSAVLFNGIKVGEVTGLGLNSREPGKIMVAIAVEPATPIRQDTSVELSFQGLTGSAAVSLKGGAANSPPPRQEGGEPPLLIASAGGAEDITTAARVALQTFGSLLEENREPLKSAISSVDIFAKTLARNSDKLDGIVSGLEQMTGGGAAKAAMATFDLAAPKDFLKIDRPEGQLAVIEPSSVVAFNSQKILRREDGRLIAFEGAQWADALPLLVQARTLEAFENAGYFGANRPGDQFTANAQLQLEIRDFSMASGANASANVELSAKIMGGSGKVLAAQLFRMSVPALAGPVGAAGALNTAFSGATKDVVAWSLANLPR